MPKIMEGKRFLATFIESFYLTTPENKIQQLIYSLNVITFITLNILRVIIVTLFCSVLFWNPLGSAHDAPVSKNT